MHLASRGQRCQSKHKQAWGRTRLPSNRLAHGCDSLCSRRSGEQGRMKKFFVFALFLTFLTSSGASPILTEKEAKQLLRSRRQDRPSKPGFPDEPMRVSAGLRLREGRVPSIDMFLQWKSKWVLVPAQPGLQDPGSVRPRVRAPPASTIGHPERNSDRETLRSGGWPEENCCWRKTGASSHAIGHPEFRHQRLPQRWPKQRRPFKPAGGAGVGDSRVSDPRSYRQPIGHPESHPPCLQLAQSWA
ncbi:hypothetical protein QTO34_009294 [Cnephaeus nilssonii]|uniref:Uncharacterized protein n=1 Tax=Cnephaeus nilssonii TaxID=3371016 RepID=A0AA40HIK2_CNENI|nr:hypothetical protein QTO34_009294 [Eptesicus nilssonii]